MARLRMIAGPNGPGKTTLTQNLRSNYNPDFGCYVNADDLERMFREEGTFPFYSLNLDIEEAFFRDFYLQHSLREKASASFSIGINVLHLSAPLPEMTHFPTLLADFIRAMLVRQERTFSFETVLSDPGKITFLQNCREAGYRNYLYCICTQNPLTNIDRVKDRVEKKGHPVPEDRIRDRYRRSLQNLYPALLHCYRAYLFNNAGAEYKLIAELNDPQLELKSDDVPRWLEEAVLNKP